MALSAMPVRSPSTMPLPPGGRMRLSGNAASMMPRARFKSAKACDDRPDPVAPYRADGAEPAGLDHGLRQLHSRPAGFLRAGWPFGCRRPCRRCDCAPSEPDWAPADFVAADAV